VWMCGPGERLELKHVATRREVFAIGAIRWARWLVQQPSGLQRP
jgi:4-hydroxy-tetrahydrodipicolinate reductase